MLNVKLKNNHSKVLIYTLCKYFELLFFMIFTYFYRLKQGKQFFYNLIYHTKPGYYANYRNEIWSAHIKAIRVSYT